MATPHPGMMDAAYFVSRGELLQWLNSTLSLGLTKVEQVDFNAKGEYEYINNYKVLQAAFNKLDIDKFVDVNKLIKARPLDNMEFMQWFKCYFDAALSPGATDAYDAVARRQQSKTGDIKAPGLSVAGGASSSSTAPSKPTSAGAKKTNIGSAPRAAPSVARPTASSGSTATHARKSSANATAKLSCTASDALQQITGLEKQMDDLKVREQELQNQVNEAERERDFYFDKLRDIEILCQLPELKDIAILRDIEKILYATDPSEAKDTIVQVQLRHGK